MSSFKLNLPTDIPWKRICVTEDMVDRVVCDNNLPPKWNSSMAIFKYVPDDEFQLYPDYKITYLKVTATITGYQPPNDEIQGEIDWKGINVETREELTELLSSYHPCNGAILQVAIGPKGNNHQIPTKEYPFFMDFEPKKRELYELATDTREKQSRSIETLNISKSGGQTESQEVMDIDMGGGGFGMQSTYAGTGGGFSFQGAGAQWGTKQLNSQESMEMRSTDSGQEKRESYAFTTHISQMYNQLNSYHIGTNRAIFFVQPRPHVLENPSGFVRGPRPVEGIQEFFLIVAQPKEQEDFCVSLRLDTAHLTSTPIMDYGRKIELTDTASAIANLPTPSDTLAGNEVKCRYGVNNRKKARYDKFIKRVEDEVPYLAPEGFSIESYEDVVNTSDNGNTSVASSLDRKALTINATAHSSVWIRVSNKIRPRRNCDRKLEETTGRAERQLRVNLVSDEPITIIGEEQKLLITTRGLCCCSNSLLSESGVLVKNVNLVPDYFGSTTLFKTPMSLQHSNTKPDAAADSDKVTFSSKINLDHSDKKESCNCKSDNTAVNSLLDKKMPIRKANEMIGYIKDQILKSMADSSPENSPRPFMETDFFIEKLQAHQIANGGVEKELHRKAGKDFPATAGKKLEKELGIKINDLTVSDLLTLENHELAGILNRKPTEVARYKLAQLGVKFKQKSKPVLKQKLKPVVERKRKK